MIRWIFVLVFCAAVLDGIFAAQYNYDYMEDDCRLDRVIQLENATKTYGFIRPVKYGGYLNNMKCNITIVAPKDHRLVVRFRRIEIYKPNSRECTDDYLLLSGNTSTYRYCGYGTPSYALISTTQMIRLQFVSGSNLVDNSRIGFDLYYTAFHTGSCHTSGDHASEHRCKKNKRCIPRELTCDRLDNCGDWSDERASACGLSTGMTVVISLIVVLVGGTCAISIGMYACAKKKENATRRARNEISPTVGYVAEPADPDAPPPYTFTVVSNMSEEKVAPPPGYESTAYTIAPATTGIENGIANPSYDTPAGDTAGQE